VTYYISYTLAKAILTKYKHETGW